MFYNNTVHTYIHIYCPVYRYMYIRTLYICTYKYNIVGHTVCTVYIFPNVYVYIGSCVGLPIYSSKRFPMRFPFGLKESIKVEVYKKKAITGDCQDETYIKLTQYYKNVKKLHLKVPAVGILVR